MKPQIPYPSLMDGDISIHKAMEQLPEGGAADAGVGADAADGEIAAAHEIDAEVEAVVEGGAVEEVILITDTDVGLGVVPAVFAVDFGMKI